MVPRLQTVLCFIDVSLGPSHSRSAATVPDITNVAPGRSSPSPPLLHLYPHDPHHYNQHSRGHTWSESKWELGSKNKGRSATGGDEEGVAGRERRRTLVLSVDREFSRHDEHTRRGDSSHRWRSPLESRACDKGCGGSLASRAAVRGPSFSGSSVVFVRRRPAPGATTLDG